ncbi:monofunctional biosynthetic peptidoglycan transglycosylase [Roseobacter sinensis]|uniref:Biosynthetic peptidoglycan transglycosylase n=1 Tax=Roseobacter sinensis TaxID=2931391 RepID=A0ABT3B8F4_9RHOB|nr:monofunctional biosynthetic peptidoglycan transglycosylase [Roseobacter sp. WL0113]MCV3269854.1 monofunctional biosynthetic peptidoglycan transglycosylase [Roseobacter sp. WL0113]
MAKRATKKSRRSRKTSRRPNPLRRAARYVLRAGLLVAGIVLGLIALGAVVNPPTTPYMFAESRRLGGVTQDWVRLDDVAPVMARSVVAAEDANFCLHWGFDLAAIKDAIADGGNRGASTLSQQTVKNVYLWHGRNYTRKALEALLTPALEAIWSKERIVEVYLNVAEFDEGVFGVKAAARHYFGVAPGDLSAEQAARLAAILPNPKARSARNPSDFVSKRARAIRSGAATIRKDGRADCFES